MNDLMEPFAALRLGEPHEPVPIRSSSEARDAVTALTRQARLGLDIFSRDLDAPVYDQGPFLDAARALVTRTRRARIRVLALDLERARTSGHRLIELARRLPTFIEIRLVAEEHRTFNTGVFVADGVGIVLRPHADRYEGVVSFHDPLQARALRGQLDEMWQMAIPDAETRALRI